MTFPVKESFTLQLCLPSWDQLQVGGTLLTGAVGVHLGTVLCPTFAADSFAEDSYRSVA